MLDGSSFQGNYNLSMFRRVKIVENRAIARHLDRFFRTLTPKQRSQPETVAIAYGAYWWHRGQVVPVDRGKLQWSKFHVCLAADTLDFPSITKRTVLVSDALLLSEDTSESAARKNILHRIGISKEHKAIGDPGRSVLLTDTDRYDEYGNPRRVTARDLYAKEAKEGRGDHITCNLPRLES